MDMRRERNLYNGSQLRPVRPAHTRTTSNWNVFRNYKSNLSFSDSFSFRKSPRKKKKTEEADSSVHRNSAFSFSKSCEATKENVEGCGVLKPSSKDECQDLIFDKENDDLIFEGLTAVMKKAILDNPKVLEFITKVLPTYPGLATIMLPNQVIALYGSWSVIKQARQQLLNLSGLHEQDASEPSQKDNKSAPLSKEDSPPVLSPQKNTNPNKGGLDMVNQSKSLPKEDGLRSSTISSSSSSTVAAADSSSSHNKKNSDNNNKTSTPTNRINSPDSDFSLPSPVANPDEEEDELDISAVMFHTTPLKRTGQIPFSSTVNGSIDSDTDSENLSTSSSQVTSRPKRSCKVVKASGSVEISEDGAQVDRLDKRKARNKSVHHIMKKQRGLATWYGKSIRGRRPKGKESKFQNSYHKNRLLSKQPGRIFTAKRHDSGGGSKTLEEDDEEEEEVEEEEEEEGEEEVIVDVVNDDDDDDDDEDEEGDDWATCAAASCSLKDRGDVTDIVWLQCEGCDTWWHCLCARLGDLTEDEASSLDFTCTFCLAPKTRLSAKRNKVS